MIRFMLPTGFLSLLFEARFFPVVRRGEADSKIFAESTYSHQRPARKSRTFPVWGARRGFVAQVSNLLYRRFAIGRAFARPSVLRRPSGLQTCDTADLQICATALATPSV